MKDLPLRLRVYIAVIAVIAFFVFLFSVINLQVDQWTSLLLFGVMVLVADLFQVQTARGVYVSVSFIIIMVAVAVAGVEVGVVVGALAAVGSDMIQGKTWYKVIFNGSQFALMAAIMGISMLVLPGGELWHIQADVLQILLTFFISGTLGAITNVMMTTVPIALLDEQKYSTVIFDVGRTMAPAFPIQMILAITLSYTYAKGQFIWFALLLTVLGLVFYSYHINRRMMDTARVASAVLGSISVGVITLDDRGVVNMVNRHASEMFHIPDGGKCKNWTEAIPDTYLNILTDTLRTGKVYRDHEINDESGKCYRLETAQLTEGRSRVTGAIIFILDVTERKRWEEQILQAEKLSVVGELAAGTAHEIRNPLTAVKGFIQLLNERLSELGMAKEKSYTDVIMDELDRINLIISGFLALSKPVKQDLRIIDMKTIIQELVILMESEALLKNINIETYLECKLPLLVVEIDQIKQVFLNLISNAFSAMPRGGTLKISATAHPKTGEVHIAFADTGIGIEPEAQSRIFEPFFTTRETGTGLGLTVTYRIIQNHGGTILVDSIPGQGTTFIVKLPGRIDHVG